MTRVIEYPLFESVDHMLRRVDEFDASSNEETPARMRDSGSDFSGGVSYDEARHMAVNGWPEGLPGLEDALKFARAPYEYSVAYEMPADIQGSAVDPGAYFAGVPEAFHTPVETHAVQIGFDGVEVVFNAFVSCGVGLDVIYARGATCILLAHSCAMSSIPCRIVGGFAISPAYGMKGADFSVVLSDWDEPIDFPKLAYWLCHASTTRRIGFRLLDSHDVNLHKINYSSPRNTRYRGGDRFKRIVVNHGLSRETLASPKAATDEIVSMMLKEEKIQGEGVEV